MNELDELASNKNVDALRSDLEQLRTDFAAMGRTVKDLATEVGSETYARVRDRGDQARAQAKKAAGVVAETIEERPLVSVLSVFVLGMLIGFLFGRQRSG